jgi:hypothetical protein
LCARIGHSGEGRKGAPQARALDAPPEFLEPGKTVLDLVAGDEARIDGADRGADQPVRLDAGLVQRLIDAALIGAECAAALQHKHDLPVIGVADFIGGFGVG